MELKPGLSALVTGAASGIGKELALALARKGVFITVVDFSQRGEELASLVERENAKFHSNLSFPSAIFVKCDVTNSEDLKNAFEKHVATFGGLDICINSAGIGTPVPFRKDTTDGTHTWRRTINVNLVAVIECTRFAIKVMEAARKPGVIINLGSAAGLYPMIYDPIYSSSKGGVVLFTRALFPYKRQGIRINVLCPEVSHIHGDPRSINMRMDIIISPRRVNNVFAINCKAKFVKTEMGEKVDANFVEAVGGFLPMEMVVKGAFELITDESKAGSCLWITSRRGLEYWPTPVEEEKYLLQSSRSRRKSSFKAPIYLKLPQDFQKIVVHTLTHNFRDATRIVQQPLRLPIGSDQVLLKILYAGVNASDVNFSSGRYFSGKKGDIRLPFDAGFEGVGIIAAVGDSVNDLKVGDPAAIMTYGSYAEFTLVRAKHVLPVPRPDPEVVAMLTSGLTASIALDKAGQMDSGKVVLVTAAAGGTGQFAVQLAKLAGNTTVATCGGKEKARLLKELGVDRVIDYKAEDIKTVLKKEYPKGVDIIYESVGGQMFDLCLNALGIYGQMIIIGMISQYQGKHGWTPANYPGLCEKLLAKSQTLAGFFLVQYSHLWQKHLNKLFTLYSTGKLKVAVDPKRFMGLGAITDAVEYLHSGKSVGKVVVCIDSSAAQQVARL